MNSRGADEIAERLTSSLALGKCGLAFEQLKPVLDERTPFRLLDRIAAGIVADWPKTCAFLDAIAADGREGGWVLIGSSLRNHYPTRPVLILEECRRYIILADTWYGADILSERVPGPALVEDFAKALELVKPWRADANRWVRRSVGVAVHNWAKRSRGDRALESQATALLAFMAPMYEERDMDAVKGVGWGLKSLGRTYPHQLADWLIAQSDRPHRRLLLRKAVTYLPSEDRQRVLQAYG